MKDKIPKSWKIALYAIGRWIGKNATPELAGQIIQASVNFGEVISKFTPTPVDDIAVAIAGPSLEELADSFKDLRSDDKGLKALEILNKFFDDED